MVRRASRLEERPVDQLDVNAAVLHRLDGVGDLHQLAGGGVGVSEVARLDELHAAALSSLSTPRATIFSASSGNGRRSAFASSQALASRHRAPRRSLRSPASPSGGSPTSTPTSASAAASVPGARELRCARRIGAANPAHRAISSRRSARRSASCRRRSRNCCRQRVVGSV